MHKLDFSTVINIIIDNCRENMHTKNNKESAYSKLDLIHNFYTKYMCSDFAEPVQICVQ